MMTSTEGGSIKLRPLESRKRRSGQHCSIGLRDMLQQTITKHLRESEFSRISRSEIVFIYSTTMNSLLRIFVVALGLFFLCPAIQAQRRTVPGVQRTPSPREIAQRAMRAVLYVRATDDAGQTLTTGSGFYVRSVMMHKGQESMLDRIVTNRHVVAHAATYMLVQ
jgi:hypothetical protein